MGIDEQAKLRGQFIEARKLAGLTQVEYERGERRLDVIEFCEVCRALEIDPAAFLRRFWTEGS